MLSHNGLKIEKLAKTCRLAGLCLVNKVRTDWYKVAATAAAAQ
jgi:hypothetical protein